MLNQNLDTFGEEIKNRVDQAIRYGDFTDLSRSVGDIINGTIDSVKGTAYRGRVHYDEWHSSDGRAGHTSGGFRYSGTAADSHSRNQGTASWGNGQNISNGQGNGARTGYAYSGQRTGTNGGTAYHRPAANRVQSPALYQKMPSGKVSGILMCVAGYTGAVVFGALLIAFSVFNLLSLIGGFPLAGIILFAVLTLGSLAVAVSGTRRLGLARRFERYVSLLNRQMYIQIPMLAEKTGRTVAYITKDLKKMMARRMFYQAHIDEEEHCLILSDQAYQEYMKAKQTYREQKRIAEEEARTRAGLSPECRKLIEDGEAYIKHIHWCNDELPGEEISAKLDVMERVVSRIFSVVQEHPEVAPELGKLMSYYLPTTKKLLDAYLEMDRQPVAGENISATKREIEGTIDTLNEAFEKLLDGLFVDKAWDISTDISVLNTVLAQDGLKDDDLKKKMNS